MADKRPFSTQQPLDRTDRVLYKEIESGVYAQTVATVDVGTAPVSPLSITQTAVNVNGDTLAVAANANRRYLLLVNDSDMPIYVRFGAGAAAVNQGVRLNAAGGAVWFTSPIVYAGQVRATHGGGAVNKVLLVTEGV